MFNRVISDDINFQGLPFLYYRGPSTVKRQLNVCNTFIYNDSCEIISGFAIEGITQKTNWFGLDINAWICYALLHIELLECHVKIRSIFSVIAVCCSAWLLLHIRQTVIKNCHSWVYIDSTYISVSNLRFIGFTGYLHYTWMAFSGMLCRHYLT